VAERLVRLATAAEELGLAPRALKRRLYAAERELGSKLLFGKGVLKVRMSDVRRACAEFNHDQRHRIAAELGELLGDTASRLDENESAIEDVAAGSWHLFEDLVEKIDNLFSEQIRLKARVSELERAQNATTATTHNPLGREFFSLPPEPEGARRRERDTNADTSEKDPLPSDSAPTRGMRATAARR
jgi:hypothetical protein